MSRGWTFRDDIELTEDEVNERSVQLDILAERWSQINTQREQRGWDEQARRETGEYDYEDDYPREPRRVTREEDPEIWAEYDRELADYNRRAAEIKARRMLDRQLEDAQLRKIEDEIGRLGARMMRPYEAWNEDEAYMQYHENGYYDPEGIY